MSLYIGILASQGSGGALLDSYGGAAAAFSLRKLSSTYGGAAVRVRRSLDNTEQDIQFAGGQLDQAALQAFVGYENLFSYSEEFNNAAWGTFGSTITANTTTAPNGTLTADTLTEDTTTTGHQFSRTTSVSTVAYASYTYSIYVKQASGNRFVGLGPVNASGAGNNYFGVFDITNGLFLGNAIPTTGAVGSPVTNGTISSVGNGWWRISVSLIASGTQYGGTVRLLNGFSNGTSTGMEYTGNGTSGIFIWGAQLNQGVTAQPYQQTTATANTANGFVTKWYTQDGNGENLLTFSEQFEDSIWTKNGSTVTANSTTAPNGTTTADSFVENATLGYHGTYRSLPITATSGQVYTLSFYVKASTRIWVFMGVTESAVDRAAWFNLSTGATGTIDAGLTARISDAGSGWYRCSITRTVSGNFTPFFDASTGDGISTYTGNGSTAFFLWGAQLSQSSWLQGYQATTTTAVSRRDASQATAASQPRIVNAGVIERENGKPAVYFNGTSGTELKTTYNVPTNASTFLATFRRHATTGAVLEGIFNADGRGGGIAFYNISPVSIFLDGNGADTATTASITNNLLAHYIMSGLYTGSTTSGTSLFANGYYTNTFTGTGASRISTPLAIGGLTGGGQPTRVMRGTVQEGVLYNSNMLSSIPAMNLNQNSYYQVYWQGTQQALLDQFGGSAAAFSLRNLSSSYRGPLVRVRRSSDNAETDIGGTFSGDLDVNSLLAFTGGQNLLPYSQDYTQVTWNKLGVVAVASATFAPDGTLTAQKINETAGGSFHILYTDITTSGAPMTYSFYAKAAERNTISVQCNNITTSSTVTVLVDLSTGLSSVITGVSGVYISHSVVNVGNGWWRIAVSGSTGSVSSHRYQTVFLNNGQTSYAGVAGSGVYIWGAQLTTGSVLQPYVPTTTAAINGANAFVTKWYDQSGIGDNTVLDSQEFNLWNAASISISTNSTTAPDGTLTADTITHTAASGEIFEYFSSPSNSIFTSSVYVKYINTQWIRFNVGFGNGAYAAVAWFDCLNGVVGSTQLVGSPAPSISNLAISNAGNGWWRISFSSVASTALVQNYIQLNSATADSSSTRVNGASYFVWGAQVSNGSEVLRYQPTTTAAAPKRDAIQTTAASQPRIVNAGSVESENGKPALFWTDGSGMRLVSSFSPIAMPQSFFAVSKLAAVSGIGAAMVFDSYDNVANSYYFTGNTDSPNNILRYISGSSVVVDASPIAEQSLVSIQHDTTTNVYYDSRLNVSGNAGVGTLSGLSIGNVRGNPTVLAPAYEWFGSIQELTVYPTNQSLRASLESNINTYYQIYWQGNGTALLDSFSGASAAYSLRNLSSAYTGPLIRVRRSSDNVERDIYGTFRGDLDLAALTSFVGANSGFVTTWYDQSGIGDNLLLQSEAFETANWNKVQSTITPNAGTDPLGGNNAERWLSNVGATGHNLNQTRSLTVGQSYTLSFWVRSNTGVDQQFGLFACDSIGSSILTATTSWQRFSFTFTATVSTAHGIIRPPSGAAVDLLIFGAQLSTGSQLLRYQPTTTAIAPVRNAVQATAASQPRIVNAGAVETINGKPAVFINGANSLAATITFSTSQMYSHASVHKVNNINAGTFIHLISWTGGVIQGPYMYYVDNRIYSPSSGNDMANHGLGTNTMLEFMNWTFGGVNDDGIQQLMIYTTNGVNRTINFNKDNLQTNTINIPFYNGVATSSMYVQERVFYNQDQAASQNGLQSNINNYYKIY